MFHTIGEAAGEIWGILKDEKNLSLSAVVRRVKQPQSVVYMGIGWLAREDKLVFTETNRGILKVVDYLQNQINDRFGLLARITILQHVLSDQLLAIVVQDIT